MDNNEEKAKALLDAAELKKKRIAEGYLTCASEACYDLSSPLLRSPLERRTIVTKWKDANGRDRQQTHHRKAYRHKRCLEDHMLVVTGKQQKATHAGNWLRGQEEPYRP